MADVAFWQLKSPAELKWHQWDDEIVIYNVTTGDTHLIDSAGAQILQAIQESPKNLSELLKDLGDQGDAGTLHRQFAYIESLLVKLYRLGVVEPV